MKVFIGIAIICAALLVYYGIIWITDKMKWNRGKCKKCNISFDCIGTSYSNIDGSRDYICPKCGKRINVYSNSVDHYFF